MDLSVDDADALSGEHLTLHVKDRGYVDAIIPSFHGHQQQIEDQWMPREGWYSIEVLGAPVFRQER